MTISASSVLRQSSKFSGANLLTKLLSIPVTIYVAMRLTPEDFGIIGYASLWTLYAAWVSIGVPDAAFREIPSLVKGGELKRSKELQNTAISADAILSVVLVVLLLGAAWLHTIPVVRTIMVLVSFGFLVGKLYNYLYTINFCHLDFSLSAKGRYLYAIGYPVLTVLLVYSMGIYGLVVSSIILSVIIILFFISQRRYSLAFRFDKDELVRLARIGLPLSLGTILYSGFTGIADRTVIAGWLSKEELGLYIFATNFLVLFLDFFKDFARVLKPTIWASCETAPTPQEAFADLKKMAIYFSLATAVLIGILQLAFVVLVSFVTVKFLFAQWVFLILVFQLFWESIEKFPEILLTSSRVDRQKIVMYVWAFCLAVNIVLDIAAVMLGFGIIGIAAATTLTQGISTMFMYQLSSKFLFDSKADFFRFLFRLVLPFAVPLCFTVLHWNAIGRVSLPILVLASFLLQLLVWLVVVYRNYSEYVPVALHHSILARNK